MGYYAKDDYVLVRDTPGTTDGSLERWSPVRETWVPHLSKQHHAQHVLRPITYREAEALKKEEGGPSQPAAALRGGKTKARS